MKLGYALGVLTLALSLAAPAAAQTEDSPIIESLHGQAIMFVLVYEYAFGGPSTSKEMTCTAVGPTDAIGNLAPEVLAEMNAAVPPEGEWQGFVPFGDCFTIENNKGKLDGVRVNFTRLIDTGPPSTDTGHPAVHMFDLKRFCGVGCGSHDWMTVYEEPEGYVLIWGYPRRNGDGDLYYEAEE